MLILCQLQSSLLFCHFNLRSLDPSSASRYNKNKRSAKEAYNMAQPQDDEDAARLVKGGD